ncbi:MAG: hypothetical protein R2824_33450, partial [Saprospiraceae bacterium]
QQWYRANDRGNRFEGSYTRKVSNPSISLVSLTGNLPAYTFGEKQSLQVRFFSPDVEEYNLHAEELRVSQFYWMEDKDQKSRGGWNTFSDWQVDYFLKRLSIDHRNLGVLVYLGDKADRHFAPAFIVLPQESSPPEIYIAQIRLGRPSSGGSFSLYKGRSKISAELILEQAISKKSSGTVFPIVIPFETLKKDGDWYTVEINLKEARTGDPFTYSFSFFHFPKS